MTDEEFETSQGMTAKQVMKKLGCSRSLLSTSEMKIALGAFRIGKGGIRFKRSHVKRLMEGEMLINLLQEQKQAVKPGGRKIESKLGLW